jgi:hypothetical protein
MKAAFALTDVEAMHAAHPDTFDLSPRCIRESVATGEKVLLRFAFQHHCGECWRVETHPAQLWVEVTAVEDGRYRGRLVYGGRHHGLRDREPVEFGPEHIYLTEAENDALLRAQFRPMEAAAE